MFFKESTKKWFLSLIPNNLLSDADSMILARAISLDELHNALKDMKVNAVPGEDGFTVNFYLTFWDEIKQILFDSYVHAYQTGQLSLTQ